MNENAQKIFKMLHRSRLSEDLFGGKIIFGQGFQFCYQATGGRSFVRFCEMSFIPIYPQFRTWHEVKLNEC